MPNCILASTDHFEIEWWSGIDSRGLYISKSQGHSSGITTASFARTEDRSHPQCFIDRVLVSGLIDDLRKGSEAITILSRVTSRFIPYLHRVAKKNGGVPENAYYTPLTIDGNLRVELAKTLETACSKENVARLEADNSAEGYSILNDNYLEDGVWRYASRFTESDEIPSYVQHLTSEQASAIELTPSQLEEAPKQRFSAPSHSISGSGTFSLTVAKSKYRCCKRGCIDYAWIDANETYVQDGNGGRAKRYHIKCAFRDGKIPTNWLNPHFEQYYALVELGFQGWIEKEREKRKEYDDEKYEALSDHNLQMMEEFVQGLKDGYELDRYERQDWRKYLRYAPIDVEPYRSARQIVGLDNPKK